jgi:hypothetical protein
MKVMSYALQLNPLFEEMVQEKTFNKQLVYMKNPKEVFEWASSVV